MAEAEPTVIDVLIGMGLDGRDLTKAVAESYKVDELAAAQMIAIYRTGQSGKDFPGDLVEITRRDVPSPARRNRESHVEGRRANAEYS